MPPGCPAAEQPRVQDRITHTFDAMNTLDSMPPPLARTLATAAGPESRSEPQHSQANGAFHRRADGSSRCANQLLMQSIHKLVGAVAGRRRCLVPTAAAARAPYALAELKGQPPCGPTSRANRPACCALPPAPPAPCSTRWTLRASESTTGMPATCSTSARQALNGKPPARPGRGRLCPAVCPSSRPSL